jgi:hypothetical protein
MLRHGPANPLGSAKTPETIAAPNCKRNGSVFDLQPDRYERYALAGKARKI